MPNLTATTPLTEIKGVGKAQSLKFSKLGIENIRDLLFHIPFRYRDTSEILSINDFKIIQEGTFLGQIVEAKNIYTRSRKVLTKVKISDANASLDISFFNQSYITKTFKIGDWYIFDGKITEKGKNKNIYNPKYEKYTGDISEQKHLGKIIGIYHETEGLSSRNIRNILTSIKSDIKEIVEEPLPKNIEKDILTLPSCIKTVHFPKDRNDLVPAMQRLAFDEMLSIALKLEKEKLEKKKLSAIPILEDKLLSKDFFTSLPFELTKDQKQSIEDILSDISKTNPMNRLLNGDVGSGKTVVAALAVLQCIRNGYSAVVLAPTTVLAQQHFETFNKLLKPFDIDIQLWISSKKTSGESENRLIIGTHAVLFKKDMPKNLNLVVVDEQHRFGVEQREHLLKEGNQTPHYLTMTATPIPRSLTEIVFGSTQVSLIKEKPKNRKEVETKFVPYKKRYDCFNWISERIKKSNYKEQAFIVYPLIEESYTLDVKAVLTEFENLKNNNFKDIKIELLHGRIKDKEKNSLIERFKKKEFHVLVTTSVIEVGIDIPDATVMVIEDAHRFGLAQLHQLRGRVGRSELQSFCFVIPSKGEEKNEETIERLKYFSSHSSGFDVAEYDLKRRGPGEVYGIKQSGIPQFKVASLTDIELFKRAKTVAREILKRDNIDLEYIYENLFK
ncbi:ATP-dependent DNA helicase RecG [Candidatus Dojkabacteria bacterium HGW-Dojkabacteria-1]|uniref:Probable DNA 3'-5' helicase RecG n=1 Tax=Candidatus Dojkabacteria bacterium HGW-Dojkabacteria-1 TaxID=2013761 RepID=A0A2N2F411_9BACT|nr:MAG: ATP-dependent DNA helicase RecG [Candidatus Dojkabacteria bacterium HGW-Dojkabacteria-1]